MRKHQLPVVLAAALAAFVVPQRVEAMRYVEFTIHVGGKAALRASQGDTGREDLPTTWRYLKTLPLRSLNGYRVRSDARNPLAATLTKVVIRTNHATAVPMSRLRLRRDRPGAAWRIVPADVEAGLKKDVGAAPRL